MIRQTTRPDTYGLHLMLRLVAIQRADALDDPDTVALFLRTLVTDIGMRTLAGPHAAIHAYPHRAAATP